MHWKHAAKRLVDSITAMILWMLIAAWFATVCDLWPLSRGMSSLGEGQRRVDVETEAFERRLPELQEGPRWPSAAEAQQKVIRIDDRLK